MGVDGRKLGSTGEHWEGAETDEDPTPERTDLRGEVSEISCERTSLRGPSSGQEGWQCQLDGRRNSYRGETFGVNEIDIRGADTEQYERGGDLVAEFRFPSGGDCRIERSEYRDPDQERRLVCR